MPKVNLVRCRRKGCGNAAPENDLRTCDRCWRDMSSNLRKGIRGAQVWLERHPGDESATRVLRELAAEADKEWEPIVPLYSTSVARCASPNLDAPRPGVLAHVPRRR